MMLYPALPISPSYRNFNTVIDLGFMWFLKYLKDTYDDGDKEAERKGIKHHMWAIFAFVMLFIGSCFEIAQYAELPQTPFEDLANDSMVNVYYAAGAFGILAAIVGVVAILLKQPLLGLVFYGVLGVYFVLGCAGDSIWTSDIANVTNDAPGLPDWWNNIWLPVIRLTYCLTLWLTMYVGVGDFAERE